MTRRLNVCEIGWYCVSSRGSNPKKTPKKGREYAFSSQTSKMLKLAYYRNHCTDSSQILQSDKDQQMLFVGGPNTRKTNPRWRTAAILKNRQSAISPQKFDRSAQNVAWRRILAFQIDVYITRCIQQSAELWGRNTTGPPRAAPCELRCAVECYKRQQVRRQTTRDAQWAKQYWL